MSDIENYYQENLLENGFQEVPQNQAFNSMGKKLTTTDLLNNV